MTNNPEKIDRQSVTEQKSHILEEMPPYTQYMQQMAKQEWPKNPKAETNITTYDSSLNKTENKTLTKKVATLLQEEFDYVSTTFDIDKEAVQNNCKDLSITDWIPGQVSYILFGKEKIPQHDHGAVWAFYSPMFQVDADINDANWTINKTIHCSEKTSDHDLAHELLHALSSSQQLEFNDKGYAIYKTGLQILTVNKQRQVTLHNCNAIGLTEGLTELLAEKIEPSKETQYTYAQAKRIADILLSPLNKKLAQAYFSTQPQTVEEFFDDFNNRQKSVSSKELINLNAEAQYINYSLLCGCIEYTMSYCETPEQLESEKERLIPLIKKVLHKNWAYSVENFIKTKKQLTKQIELNNNANIEYLNNKIASFISKNSELENIPENITNYAMYESFFLKEMGF